jgi:hypothetical protein
VGVLILHSYLRRRITFLLILGCFTVGTFLSAKTSAKRKLAASAESSSNAAIRELKNRVQSLEDQLSKEKADIETVRATVKAVNSSDPNALLYNNNTNNQTYLRTGVSLISPKTQALTGNADDGVGAFLGIGQYIGKHHVGEFAFEYDLYPSLTLRYRFEFHPTVPAISISPVIGYKIKVANFTPFDNFLSNPNDVPTSFFVFGANLAIPLTNSAVVLEFLYLVNNQAFFFTNVGVQFFI